MNGNNLVHEAVNLGGKVQGYSGQVFFRKTRKADPNQYVVIALNFYSKEELLLLFDLADSLGLEGFLYETPTNAPTITPTSIVDKKPPTCEIHNCEMIKSKFKSEWICPTKLGHLA